MDLLAQKWDIDPLVRDFVLGRIPNVSDYIYKSGRVTFHVPYLVEHQKYILWTCYWPDCHNCCQRQGRLPLTESDLITIKSTLNYERVSDFVENETTIASWREPGGTGMVTMTSINLKRKADETENEDGTYIPCRFLDDAGYCTLHPGRPGVCYLYPFSTWLVSEKEEARVHATYQFTGDCPGFYAKSDISEMISTLDQYASIIYDYNMKHLRTVRKGLGAVAMS